MNIVDDGMDGEKFQQTISQVVHAMGMYFKRFPQAFTITTGVGEVGIDGRTMQVQVSITSVTEGFIEPTKGVMVLPEGEMLDIELFK